MSRPAVLGEVKTLGGLELQVLAVGFVKLLGNEQLLHRDRLLRNGPAVAAQVGDAVLVAFDPFGIDGCGSGRIPPSRQDGPGHQNAAHHRGGHRYRGDSALADLGGKNKHSATLPSQYAGIVSI